ncbi:MAG TPA: macrolide family glycosyltransferase [Streptosporangiaceae bacterium]|nr:macrolide family glycosyltransferase [Streptosporangiaceae bacterium]
MAHIAIVSIPHTGHMDRLYGVATELVRRGHEVTFVTTATRAGQVRELGAEAIEYRSPMEDEAAAANRDDDLSTVLPRLLREAKAVLPVMERRLGTRAPDCVLTDVLAWGGAVFAHKHGIVDIQMWLFFASNEVFSLEDRYESSLGDLSLLEEFHTDLTAFADEVRTPGVAEYIFASRDRNIVFMPRVFQYAGDTFDERFVFVGPGLVQADPPKSGEGPPLVLMSMGTAHDRGSQFFRACALAMADLPIRLLLVTGGCVDLAELQDLPGNVEVKEWIDYAATLGRADVFVTHGGINGVMEALHYAVPVVVIPDRMEQIANAERVVELGVGVRVSKVGELRDAVLGVLSGNEIRKRLGEMRAAVRSAGGPSAAADAIEGWIKLRPRAS